MLTLNQLANAVRGELDFKINENDAMTVAIAVQVGFLIDTLRDAITSGKDVTAYMLARTSGELYAAIVIELIEHNATASRGMMLRAIKAGQEIFIAQVQRAKSGKTS